MMNVQPNSRALILRATHILVATIKSADAKPWAPRQPNGEERIVSLVVRLDEVIKGKVKQTPGDSIAIDAKQVRIGFAWGPMPGIWSRVPVEPGTRLVAFSQTESEDAAIVLNDPAGIRLMPAGQALEDVHLAAEAEAQHLDLGGILARAKPIAASLGFLFAEYLWARYEPVAMADIGKFDLVADFLEAPALNRYARTTLLTTLLTAVDAPDPPATQHIDRLAIAMFHLLGTPEARDLHDNLIGTYLPNLLGITDKGARTADQVFHDHPAERTRAREILNAYQGSAPTGPLVAWLSR